MKAHHVLALTTGYLGLGGLWVTACQYVLPATAQDATSPPGGIAGQLWLWPWSAAGYLYSVAKYGTAPGTQGVQVAANQEVH